MPRPAEPRATPPESVGPKMCCGATRPPGTAAATATDTPVDVPAPRTAPAGSGSEAADLSGMVHLEGGAFLMGTVDPDGFPEDGEGPVRRVTVDGFFIDEAAVTNVQFSRFIDATGYITEAERFGWSFVFKGHLPPKQVQRLQKVQGSEWWVAVPGARWDRPLGERSDLRGREDHPVVQVSWNDACAYAAWSRKRLPTEAEWEFAARGGREQTVFPWGDRLEPAGKHRCNVWQGRFPESNSEADGHFWTCPVRAYPPNGFGLYNVCGNVWEWTADGFSKDWHAEDRPETRDNPRGPDPATCSHRVQKGGSYLCHRSYCNRYRVGARTGNTPDSATTNAGFRCACDA